MSSLQHSTRVSSTRKYLFVSKIEDETKKWNACKQYEINNILMVLLLERHPNNFKVN
jgi:hypothetical protein